MSARKLKKSILTASVAAAFGLPGLSAAVSVAPSDDGVIRINAGGNAYLDSLGNSWSADVAFNTGRTGTTGEAISGTDDDVLYQTERWDREASPELAYSVDVPNGDYVVTLHFAEIYSKAFNTGARVFDVLMENDVVLPSLDIYSEVGANTALIKEIPISVADGSVDIGFLHGVENPKVAAIEIAPVTREAQALRINVGGPDYVDNEGKLWLADYGYNTGLVSDTSDEIGGTDNDPLYQSERWDRAHLPELGYSLEVPNGEYLLRLHFAEIYSGTSDVGARVFNVLVEGDMALPSLDIYKEVGANTTLIKEIPVSVRDGQLNIDFIHQVENPKVSAIELVERREPFVVRVNAGGPEYTDASGLVWMEDSGFNTGQVSSSGAAIDGTDDDLLYQSERWDKGADPELRYGVEVPNGDYLLRLHFAEVYFKAFSPGSRVFDVAVEGNRVLTDFDIYKEVGGNRALIKEIPVTINDGRVDIEFLHKVENPKLSGFELVEIIDSSGSTGDVGDTGTVDGSKDHQPVATNDSETVEVNKSVTVDVLANDTGLEDSPVTVTLVDMPSLGSAMVSENKVIYTPSGTIGSNRFSYKVTDVDGDMALASVNVEVVCTNCTNDSTINLSWSHASPDDVFGYTVYYGSSADAVNQALSTLTNQSISYQSYSDLGLQAGDTACFGVTAYDDVGESESSPIVCQSF